MEESEKYVKSKSENPYRYGVLVGNHVEDRFGSEVKLPSGFLTLTTEQQEKFNFQNATGINYRKKDLLTEKEEVEREEHIECRKKGVKGNIFFGHGPTQEAFDQRDFKTMNELVYATKERSNFMMDPHYRPEQTRSVLTFTGSTLEDKKRGDIPVMFGGLKPEERVARHSGEATKVFNLDYTKIGLRK